MAADPLERVWALLFTGDGPDNRVLQTDSRGRCTVVEFRPDGGSTPRTVQVAGQPVTVEVPTKSEGLLLEAGSVEEAAALLEEQRQTDEDAALAAMTPQERAEQDERLAGWASYWERKAALDAATVHHHRRLGRLDAWLAAQPDPDGTLAAAARGRDVACRACQGTGAATPWTCSCVPLDLHAPVVHGDPDPECPRCAGTGRLPEPCSRCAGSGTRRSTGTLIVHDERGGRHELQADASKVEIAEETIEPPADSSRQRWGRYRLSIAHLATELRDAGVDVPEGPAVVLQTGGRAVRFDGSKTSFQHAGPAGVVAAFLRLLPGGVRPDLAPEWMSKADSDRTAAECRFDDKGRAQARRVLLRAVRPLAAAWAELVDHAAALETVLSEGWQVQVWLSTGFIATGEHGPKAQLVAIPPELHTRSIEAAEALEDSLDRSVETLVAQVRTAGLEHLAQQLRTTAQGR